MTAVKFIHKSIFYKFIFIIIKFIHVIVSDKFITVVPVIVFFAVFLIAVAIYSIVGTLIVYASIVVFALAVLFTYLVEARKYG